MPSVSLRDVSAANGAGPDLKPPPVPSADDARVLRGAFEYVVDGETLGLSASPTAAARSLARQTEPVRP